MNISKYLLPVSLALITTWGLQHFFGPTVTPVSTVPTTGQRLTVVPAAELQLRRPLNGEVDFIDSAVKHEKVVTMVETLGARYEFSNDGAVLESFQMKQTNSAQPPLITIHPGNGQKRETGCFLVALEGPTPYQFDLVDHQKSLDSDTLVYRASLENGALIKTFKVYHNEFKVDMGIQLDDKVKSDVLRNMRIIFPSPFLPELVKEDQVTGIVNDASDRIQIINRDERIVDSSWVKPSLFGTQSRYFVHAMVQSTQDFVERAYYRELDFKLYTYIEGEAKPGKEIALSFYLGPKVTADMIMVEGRLSQTINYGWFGFVTKPLSLFLLWLLNLIYGFVHNYGVAIILLTMLIKFILLPFSYNPEQHKEKNAEFQKRLRHIDSIYKNDPQAHARARLELMKKHGMPGIGGIIMMFAQLPIFLALTQVFWYSVQLYRAPFFGWITDLSMRDPYFIVPMLTGFAWLLHSPRGDMQQKTTAVVMVLVIFAMTASMPAGCSLYILVSTLLAVLQMTVGKALRK